MSYRSDLDAAHSRITSLEREKKELEKKLQEEAEKAIEEASKKKEVKMRCSQCNGRFHRMGWALFGSLAGIVLSGFFVWFLYTVITENGPEDCYVKGEGLVFNLMREMNWGEDRTIGQYRSMKEALDDAAKLGCKIK